MTPTRQFPPAAAILAALLLALAALALASSPAVAQSDTPETVSWYALYWNNSELDGTPVLARDEAAVDYDWGTGSPAAAVNADNFSARWTTRAFFTPGTYRFTTTSDDGIRVWLQDEWILDNWSVHPAATNSAVRTLDGSHNLVVEYFEASGEASVSFTWERLSDGDTTVTISPTRGPAGTVLTVDASGFEPGAELTIATGRANSEPVASQSAFASANGNVRATIPVPATAASGERWVVRVSGGGLQALSAPFTVTPLSPNEPQPDSTCGPVYTVEPGDWLTRIARRCNTTVAAILAANPTLDNPSLIYPGRQLVMPGYLPGTPEPQAILDRVRAAAGTTLRLYAAGLPENRELVVGLGPEDGEPAFTTAATTNSSGELNIGLTLPVEAVAGERWVATVYYTANDTLISRPVTVVDAGAISATPLYNLRLREGPGTATGILDVVPVGTTLDVLAVDESGLWVQVSYRNQLGWIAAWLADLTGDLDDLPRG